MFKVGNSSTQYFVLSTEYSILHSALALLTALTLGCSSAPSPPPAPATKINLVRADAKALSDLVASHKGKVVLVDYWATWCLPCVENFHHTVDLSKKYGEKGLAAISVSFDLLEDEAKVRDFLAKQGASFENMISSHDNVGQKSAADFDIGPLPEYRLYDREGKLIKKWESGVDQAELDAKIQELLAAK
jgi:thiol-disulfide isomerase/thioredoxin